MGLRSNLDKSFKLLVSGHENGKIGKQSLTVWKLRKTRKKVRTKKEREIERRERKRG